MHLPDLLPLVKRLRVYPDIVVTSGDERVSPKLMQKFNGTFIRKLCGKTKSPIFFTSLTAAEIAARTSVDRQGEP